MTGFLTPAGVDLVRRVEAVGTQLLYVQIQPALAPEIEIGAVVARLALLSPLTVEWGEDDGPFVNIHFEADDVWPLWELVRVVIQTDAALARCAIVCGQGKQGWDDYRLLHHFDPARLVDEVA